MSGHIALGINGSLEKSSTKSEKLLKRRLFLCAGFLSVSVGVLGIILPVLDTTPFMLLGAYCFARSSKKWHDWLLKHPIFGDYIVAFQEQRGLTVKQKRRIAITTTLMMSITAMHGLYWVAGIVWFACMSFLYFSRSAVPGSLEGDHHENRKTLKGIQPDRNEGFGGCGLRERSVSGRD